MSEDRNQGPLLNLRVLDQQVVDEVSTHLKGLIDRATGAVATLGQSSAAAGEATGDLQSRLQLGARLLQAIDQEAARLEPLMRDLDTRVVESKEISVHAAQQLTKFREELRLGIEQLASERFTAENSFGNLRSHATRLEARLNEAIDELAITRDGMNAARDELDRNMTDFRTRLEEADLDERLARLDARLNEAVTELREHREAAQAESQALESRVGAIRAELTQAAATLGAHHRNAEGAAKSLDDKAQEFQAVIARAVDDFESRNEDAETTSAALQSRFDHFQSEFSAAVAYLETRKREIDNASNTLADGIADFNESVRQVKTDLDEQRADNESARAAVKQQFQELQRELSSAAMRQEERLTVHQRESLDRIEPVLTDLEARKRAADELWDAIETRFDETSEQARRSVREMRDEIDPIIAELQDRRNRANEAVERLERDLAENRAVIEAASSGIDERREELDRASERLEVRVSAFNVRLENASEQMDSGMADLRAFHDVVRADGAELQMQMSAIEARLSETSAGLRDQKQRTDAAVDRFDSQVTRLDDCYQQATEQIEPLLADMDARRSALESMAAAVESRFAETSEQVRAAARDVRERANAISSDLEHRAESAEQARARVEEALAENRTLVSGAIADVRAQKAEVRDVTDRLDTRVAAFNAQLAESTDAITQRRDEIEQASRDLAMRVEDFNGRLDDAVQRLESRIEASNEDSSLRIEAAIGDLRAFQQSAAVAASGLQAQVIELDSRLEEAGTSLREQKQLTETAIESFRGEADRVERRVTDVGEKTEALERELDETAATFAQELEERTRGFVDRVEPVVDDMEVRRGKLRDIEEAVEVRFAEASDTLDRQQRQLEEQFTRSAQDIDTRFGEINRGLAASRAEIVAAVSDVNDRKEEMQQVGALLDERMAEFRTRLDDAAAELEERTRQTTQAARDEVGYAVTDLRAQRKEATAKTEELQTTIALLKSELEAAEANYRDQTALADTAMAEFHERAQQSRSGLDALAEEAGAIEDRLTSAVSRFEAEMREKHDEMLGSLESLIADAEVRHQMANALGADVDERFADVNCRIRGAIEGFETQIGPMLDQVEGGRRTVDELARTVERRFAETSDEVRTAAADLQQRLDPIVVDLEARHREVNELGQKIEATATGLEARIEPVVHELEQTKLAADDAVGRVERELQRSGEHIAAALADVISRREQVDELASMLHTQSEEFRARLDNAMTELGRKIDAGADEAREAVGHAVTDLRSQRRAVAKSTEELHAQVASMKSDLEAAEAALREQTEHADSAVLEFQQRSEESRVLLESLAAQSSSFARRIDESVAHFEGDLRHRHDEMIHRLEPVFADLESRKHSVDALAEELERRFGETSRLIETSVGGIEQRIAPVISEIELRRRAVDQLTEAVETRYEETSRAVRAESTRIGEVGEEIDARAAEAQAAIDARLAVAAETVESTVSGIESRITPMLEEVARSRRVVDETAERVEREFAAGRAEAAASTAELDIYRKKVDQLAADLDSRAADLNERLEEALASVEGRLESGVSEAREQLAFSIDDLRRFRRSAATSTGELEAQVSALQTDVARAEENLRSQAAQADTAVLEFQQQLETVRAEVDEALADFTDHASPALLRVDAGASAVERLHDEIEARYAERRVEIDALVERLEALGDVDQVGRTESACAELRREIDAGRAAIDSRLESQVQSLEARLEAIESVPPAPTEVEIGDSVEAKVREMAVRLDEQLAALQSEVDARVGSMLNADELAASLDARVAAHVAELRADSLAEEDVNTRIEASLEDLRARVDGQLHELHEELNRRIESLDETVGALETATPADRAADDRLEALEARTQEIVTGLDERFDAVDARAAQVVERLERRIEVLQSQSAQAIITGEPGQVDDRALVIMTDQVNELRSGLDEARKQIEACRESAENAQRSLDARIPDLHSRLTDLAGDVQRHMEQARTAADERVQALRAELAQRTSDGDSPAEALVVQHIAGVEEKLEDVVGRLEEQITHALVQLEDGREHAEASIARIDAQCASLEDQFRVSVERFDRKLEEAAHAAAVAAPPEMRPPASVPARSASAPATAATEIVGETVLSDVRYGAYVTGFVAAVNGGNPEACRAFIDKRYAPTAVGAVDIAQRLSVYNRLHEMTGGIDIRKLEVLETGEVQMLAQSRLTGDWQCYVFDIATGDDAGIVSVAIDPLELAEAMRLMEP